MSNKFLLSYTFQDGTRNGLGSVRITQSEYMPITEEVLDDACRIVREQSGFSDEAIVAPLSFVRFED